MDRTDLPVEAVKINGSYIEDLIPGYTTVITSGREALEAEVEWYDSTGSDGGKIRRDRMPSRIININFFLHGDSVPDMRSKLRELNKILDKREAEFIFNDEPDCLFNGKPIIGNDFSDYKNACRGTWSVLCEDPYKYSVYESTVPLTTRTDTIIDEEGNETNVTSYVFAEHNDGCKAYPTFEIDFAEDESSSGAVGSNADCGYVLFAKGGTDYSIQIGDDEEVDIVTSTRVNHDFSKGLGGFAAANSITPFRSGYAHQGTIKYQSTSSQGVGLKASSYGTVVADKYYGPFVVKDLGYDLTGNFKLSWRQVLACASDTAVGKAQRGSFWIYLLDASNTPIYGFGINKKTSTKLRATPYCYTQEDGLIALENIDVSYTGEYGYKSNSDTVGRRKTSYIQRYQEDGRWRVAMMGCDGSSADIDDGTEAKTVRKIAFYFGKYGEKAFKSNRVTNVKLVDGDFDKVNTFGSGDSVTVGCEKAEIILNDKISNDLGDYGNNWEDMYLDTGTNLIYVQFSDWINPDYLPEVTMKYRRRWL